MRILSGFFNLHLRRRIRAVAIDRRDILTRLLPVFEGAEALGFTAPIIRGGALRDALQGKDINDYDLYVSRAQTVNELDLPSVKAPHAFDSYRKWLGSRLHMSDIEGHGSRWMERPYLSFSVRFAGVDKPVDLVLNDEPLSAETLAVDADATMNGIAATREKIVAHPLFLRDVEQNIFRPTWATVGNIISAPQRYVTRFSRRNPGLKYRPF